MTGGPGHAPFCADASPHPPTACTGRTLTAVLDDGDTSAAAVWRRGGQGDRLDVVTARGCWSLPPDAVGLLLAALNQTPDELDAFAAALDAAAGLRDDDAAD